MKKLSIIILFLFSSTLLLYGQIGGVSNSKLNSLNIDAIPHHTVEFEPTVFHAVSKKSWDGNGKLVDLYGSSDSVFKTTGLAFRFTYGLWDKLELGASISTDLALTNLGIKYKFWTNNKMGFAAIAGANIPLGNKTIDNTIRLSENLTSLGGGIVYTAYINDKFSIDASAQYLFFAEKTEDHHKGSYYLNTDLGYYIFDHQLQLVAAFGYQSASFENFNSNTITMYPGFTVETGKNYVLVIQAPFDLAGKNALKNSGLAFSLTIAID